MKCRSFKKFKRFFIFIILFLVVIAYLKNSLDNAVLVYAETDAKNIISRSVNNVVMNIINTDKITYSDLTDITYDTSGDIKSISLNTTVLNYIKSNIIISIMNELENIKERYYGIPLGNIIGSNISSGRGPKIKIKIVPLGTVAGETRNYFLSAGINQTVHRIVMDITASVSVLAPFSDASVDLTSSVCIAETVIIGSIPNAYFNYTN